MLLAVLLLASPWPAAADMPQSCTCIGLGEVQLLPADGPSGPGGLGSGPDPLAYSPPPDADGSRIDARITFLCAPAAGGTRCTAEIDSSLTWSGGSSVGSGSGSSQAPAPPCLVLSQALQAAWQQALGESQARAAPIPCS